MKKYVIWLFIGIFSVSMVFMGVSCKEATGPATEEVAVEEEAVEEAEAPAEEEVVVVGEEESVLSPGLMDFKDIDIIFNANGPETDIYATMWVRGAQDAEKAFGVNVEYLYEDWDVTKILNDFRESVAKKPDGILTMGIPGDDAFMPLVDEAVAAGILVQWTGVDVPIIRAKYGQGYVGSELYGAGAELGNAALRFYPDIVKAGAKVVVWGPWDMPGRFLREQGVVDVFEEAGVIVIPKLITAETAIAPELLTPEFVGSLLSDPDIVLVCFPGGQQLGATPMYFEAAGLAPGDILAIGFDSSPAIIEAFKNGYVQISSDQQIFLQGFLAIQSLVFQLAYKFSPLTFNTGIGLITEDNYEELLSLIDSGIR